MKNYFDFNRKFEVDRFIIKEYNFWIWSLRKNQSTIGSCILFPKRECYRLSELTKEELTEMKLIYSEIENTLYKVFQYTNINYLTLMMVDPIVHTHILPRYKKALTYRGSVYGDDNYPHIPNLNLDLVEDFNKSLIINDLKKLI